MAFRVQKPSIGARLDRDHPLAQGLAIALPLNEGAGPPRNLVNGASTSVVDASTPSVAWSPSAKGIALVAGNRNNYVAINHPSITNNHFSVEAIFYFNAATTNASPGQGIWSVGSKSATIEFQGSGSNEAIFFASGGGVLGPTSITYPAGVMNHWLGVANGSGVTFYQKGLPTVQASITPTVSSFTQSFLFETVSGPGYALQGGVLALHAWARPLTAAEVAERFDDPWGIYRRAWNPKYFLKPSSIAVASTDSAVIVDAATIGGALALADSASLADAGHIAATVGLTDAGILSDTQAIGAKVSLADPATLVDTSFLNAILTPADLASFADSLLLNAFMSPADGATLVDSAALNAALALFDSASLIDSDSLAAFLSSLESASLIDAATTASTLSALDSAGLAETSALGLLLAVVDSAGLNENDVVLALTAAADSMTLVDAAAIAELIFALDDAGLVDVASLNRNLPTCLVGYASFVQGAPDPRFTKVTNL